MFTKKSVLRVFTILLVVLMMSGSASASPLNAPVGTGFTYQGKLTDGGAPANGTYDFVFKLYNALSGGALVGSTVTKNDVTVTTGLFTVQLDFGSVFDGTALYLEIGVRPGASTGAYTALTPRQALTATPYALGLLPGARINTSSSGGFGLTVINAGTGDGIRAYSNSIGNNYAAIWAENLASGTAVYASSANGYGVYGSSPNNVGVWGDTTNSIGVVGKATATTGNTTGVWGEMASSGTYARAVVGWATKTTGVNYGVWGESLSATGTGVYGQAHSGGCISGVNGTCRGVFGTSNSGNGVLGRTNTGVAVFADASGAGTAVYANAQGTGTAVSIFSTGTGDLINATTFGLPLNNLRFRVTNAGNVTADSGFTTPAADMAEMLPAAAGLEAGDVLVIGADGQLALSTVANQPTVVGVYSTKPGFVGGGGDDADLTGKVPLAVTGIVPVKVSTENGAIQPGDLLVASSTPGYAMRAPANPAPGTVIGKALGTLDSGTGLVSMLIMLR